MSVYSFDLIRSTPEHIMDIYNQLKDPALGYDYLLNDVHLVLYCDGTVSLDVESWHGSPFSSDDISVYNNNGKCLYISQDNDGVWYVSNAGVLNEGEGFASWITDYLVESEHDVYALGNGLDCLGGIQINDSEAKDISVDDLSNIILHNNIVGELDNQSGLTTL